MAKNRGICAAHTCIPQYREYYFMLRKHNVVVVGWQHIDEPMAIGIISHVIGLFFSD